jgi:hypothetical protein
VEDDVTAVEGGMLDLDSDSDSASKDKLNLMPFEPYIAGPPVHALDLHRRARLALGGLASPKHTATAPRQLSNPADHAADPELRKIEDKLSGWLDVIGILILISIIRKGDMRNNMTDLYAIPFSAFCWVLRGWETQRAASTIKPLVKRLRLECSTETHDSINRHIFFHRTFYTFVTAGSSLKPFYLSSETVLPIN